MCICIVNCRPSGNLKKQANLSSHKGLSYSYSDTLSTPIRSCRSPQTDTDTGIHSNIASCSQSLIYLQDGALECFCVCGTVSVIYKYFHSPPRQILLLLPILPWFSLLHCAHNPTHLLFIHIRMYGARQIKPEIAHYHSVLRFQFVWKYKQKMTEYEYLILFYSLDFDCF